MLSRTIPLIAVAMFASLLVACGDDDAGGSPTATATRIDTGGATSTATPASTEDGKTPPPSGESEEPTTPGETAPGEVPTPPPTAAVGTPAVEPADLEAFLAEFEGQPDLDMRGCQYSQTTAVTDCGDWGLYAIDPPIVGQDINCTLWVLAGTPRAISCSSADPPETKYYEIME